MGYGRMLVNMACPTRIGAPPLQQTIARQGIDHAADDPRMYGRPSHITSFYRVLEFIGRSRELIVHGNKYNGDFVWMGAVSSVEMARWAQRLSMYMKRVFDREEEEAGGYRGGTRPRPLVPNVELITEDDIITPAPHEGLNMFKFDIRWRYAFHHHNVYALAITRTSGTKGELKYNLAAPGDLLPRGYTDIDMHCKIRLIRIDHLFFKDVAWGTRIGDSVVRERSWPLQVQIRGIDLEPNKPQTHWEEKRHATFNWITDSGFRRQEPLHHGISSDLRKYASPATAGDYTHNLLWGYKETGDPVKGGWRETDCYVPADLHLFDFDPSCPPAEFTWVPDLAAAYDRWDEKTPFLMDEYAQFYGMRGPAVVDPRAVMAHIDNPQLALRKLVRWLQSRGIPLSAYQRYLLNTPQNDWSVLRPVFRRPVTRAQHRAEQDWCNIQ